MIYDKGDGLQIVGRKAKEKKKCMYLEQKKKS
jgi:hypothetical protein